VALGLLTSLVLYFDVRIEMAKQQSLEQKKQEDSAVIALNLAGDLETMRQSVRALEAAPASQPAGQGINLSKRAQALRMCRRGESIATIAAALQTPRNEIDLLLKVREWTNGPSAKAS
jgi:hypothetical protein